MRRELLAVTCDSCGAPMVPNVSTMDEDGCGWISLDPHCPELAYGRSARGARGCGSTCSAPTTSKLSPTGTTARAR